MQRGLFCTGAVPKLMKLVVLAVAIAFIIGAVLAPKVYLDSIPGIDIKFLLLCIGYCFWGITQVSQALEEDSSTQFKMSLQLHPALAQQ